MVSYSFVIILTVCVLCAQALSQPHKQLHSLADHVPHGYRRKALFEVLIRHNVPFLRASWFIKVNYLNQVDKYVKNNQYVYLFS